MDPDKIQEKTTENSGSPTTGPIQAAEVTRTAGAGRTDVGNVRRTNQDRFLVDEELGLYVVADGMGGHAAGDVASEEAIAAFQELLCGDQDLLSTLSQACSQSPHDKPLITRGMQIMESAGQAATYHVYGLAELDRHRVGMGTTLSALLVRGSVGLVAQVGDSRVYRVRDGKATQITEDHTLVAWQVKHGLLTEEEAERSPSRNVITRAVGSHDHVEVDVFALHVHVGDRYMLCSDGLHHYVTLEEIAQVTEAPVDQASHRFVDLALERGGRDNITAVTVRVQGRDTLSPTPPKPP